MVTGEQWQPNGLGGIREPLCLGGWHGMSLFYPHLLPPIVSPFPTQLRTPVFPFHHLPGSVPSCFITLSTYPVKTPEADNLTSKILKFYKRQTEKEERERERERERGKRVRQDSKELGKFLKVE